MTITLKRIPSALHAMLKDSAARNRRSLNSEILARLEADTGRPALGPDQYAADLRRFTAGLPRIDPKHVSRYKRSGRP